LADQGRMVKMWFLKAAGDLQVAKLVKDVPDVMDSSVFHSQQAAEKAIKGYLTFHQIRFGKTHDIEKLLNLVASIDKSLADELQPATILTRFAVAYRYPEEADPPEPLNKQSCDKVYVLANWVYEEMKSRCK
jgi:HEPN domain-containing protein